MADKTNIGLVEYAKAQLGKPYWFGTFGQIANAKLWSEKAKQYPRYYSDKRKNIMKERGDEGQKVHDCLGLWKGYMMSIAPNMPAQYDAKYDYSADSIFAEATEKGDISTLPKNLVGIGLHKKGHFGIYIGNGREIEARGFDYGVMEDDVANTNFTEWFKIPFISYQEEPDNVTFDDVLKEGTYIVKSGDTLSKLASEWGCSVDDIAKLNNIKNKDLILIGDKLIIPEKSEPKNDTSTSPETPEIWVGTVATKKDPLRVRNGKGFSAPVVKLLPKGSSVKIIGNNDNGWYKLADGSGYVFADYIAR